MIYLYLVACVKGLKMKQTEITANTIADYFLTKLREVGDNISHLKLQKLVYYAQAWFLALYDKRLFAEEFQAWIHGPVVPSVYDRFKKNGWKPILAKVDKPQLSDDIQEHLEEILRVFNKYTALDLEIMTHSELPWMEARGNTPATERSRATISQQSMKEYCLSLLEKGKSE